MATDNISQSDFLFFSQSFLKIMSNLRFVSEVKNSCVTLNWNLILDYPVVWNCSVLFKESNFSHVPPPFSPSCISVAWLYFSPFYIIFFYLFLISIYENGLVLFHH